MAMYEFQSNSAALLTPAQVADLLVRPMLGLSVAAECSTVINIGTKDFRIPIVVADPTANWVAEGQEIAPSDMTLSELLVTPSKVAGLTILSRELAEDSSPEAASVVGAGLARDLSRKIDEAWVGALAAPAPSGLGALAGVTDGGTATSGVDALDALLGAVSLAQQEGANLTHFVTSPLTAGLLAAVKTGTGSALNVLQPDPSQPTRWLVSGVPILVSPYVASTEVWGIDSSRSYLVVRDDATVETDRSVFFTSMRVAVLASVRLGYAWPHPASVVKITVDLDA